MNDVERMEKHLKLIRSAAGWSAKEFGDRIGVTRQTINNIESGRSRLTKTQYIAMRSVLDDLINRVGVNNTRMLADLLEMLIDNPDKYPKEDREKLFAIAKTMESAITSGSSTRTDVSKQWSQFKLLLGVASIGIGLATMYSDYKNQKSWLAKLINSKEE